MTDHATALPVPETAVSVGLEPFNDGLVAGELRLPYDRRTGRVVWYPRTADATGLLELEWRLASGRATVHSCTVVRRPTGIYRGSGAYVLAYVTLEEGPRLLTQIVGADPEDISIGTPVRAAIDRDGDAAILRFRPISTTEETTP